MADKPLVLEVYRIKNGWCAEGTVTLDNGNKYYSRVEISATSRPDLTSGDDDDDNPPEREEAVKELLDQLISLMENPLLQSVLPPSVKITLKAIKGTRKLIEKHKAGSMAAGFNLAKIGQCVEEGNEIIVGAVRAQRLYGKC